MSSDARDIRGIHDDGFHEIHLSGKQLIFLFMATTVVSVVIFLCGVLVGRGARPIVPAQAATLAQAPSPDDVAADAEIGAAGGEAPGADVKADGLTYYERLNQQQPAAERLDEPAPADESPVDPAPAPSAQASAPPPQPASAQPASAQNAAAQNAAAQNAAAQNAAAQNAAAQNAARNAPASTPPPPAKADASPAPAPVAAKTAPPAAGAWSVQVAALRQRGEADTVARRLTRKGYDAYVLEPSGRANRVYRVRVGRFASRGEADKLKDRLAREEQFKPWVTQ